MSFRIGVLEEGKLETIYGVYPKKIEVLCKLLKENYTKYTDVKKLIEQGDIYELKDSIDKTKYYARDKGDPLDACVSYKESVDDLEKINTLSSPVDYYFIWTNKWNVYSTETSKWMSITKFLNSLKKKK